MTDDDTDPVDTAINVATEEFVQHTKELGIEEMMASLATDRLDVYPVEPCDCEREAYAKE